MTINPNKKRNPTFVELRRLAMKRLNDQIKITEQTSVAANKISQGVIQAIFNNFGKIRQEALLTGKDPDKERYGRLKSALSLSKKGWVGIDMSNLQHMETFFGKSAGSLQPDKYKMQGHFLDLGVFGLEKDFNPNPDMLNILVNGELVSWENKTRAEESRKVIVGGTGNTGFLSSQMQRLADSYTKELESTKDNKISKAFAEPLGAYIRYLAQIDGLFKIMQKMQAVLLVTTQLKRIEKNNVAVFKYISAYVYSNLATNILKSELWKHLTPKNKPDFFRVIVQREEGKKKWFEVLADNPKKKVVINVTKCKAILNEKAFKSVKEGGIYKDVKQIFDDNAKETGVGGVSAMEFWTIMFELAQEGNLVNYPAVNEYYKKYGSLMKDKKRKR